MIVEALVAGYFAEQLFGKKEQPVWSGAAGQGIVTIIQRKRRTKVWWELHVATEGQTAMVKWAYDYAEIVAAVTPWDFYLQKGGTVGAWIAANQDREVEVAELEKMLP